MASTHSHPEHLYGLVDMGSNGIRFSISDLSPPTQRIMPALFQDRAAISLYDAQYALDGRKQDIPTDTVAQVIQAMRRFQRTCQDFSVPQNNIRVLATEATRVAGNSLEFRQRIKQHLGWEVEMLSKEEEGKVGAMGVASSFRTVDGLVMDLGGGSVQMTWLHNEAGATRVGEAGSVGLPYGAAALLRRLDAAQKEGQDAVDLLREELQSNLRTAFEQITSSIADSSPHGRLTANTVFPLFLSGGGFRGWGSLLMDMHPSSPYPIPIINGFMVPASSFRDTTALSVHVASTESIFRVSTRRAGQIPAVAFLVACLTDVLPAISTVRFCQGGVREGALFSSLFPEIRAQAPLTVSTIPYAPPSVSRELDLLRAAIPATISSSKAHLSPPQLIQDILPAFANLLYYHSPLLREVRPAAALRCTTTGVLAGTHSLLHDERAALALALCERWGGVEDLSAGEQEFFSKLQGLLEPRAAWWVRFLGIVGGTFGTCWPAGLHAAGTETADRIKIEAQRLGVFGSQGLQVVARIGEDEDVAAQVAKLEKLGKRKNWVGGKEGWGMRVEVLIERLQAAR